MMAASMEAHCIPFTEIPHTAALFADALYRFPRVARFYAHDPFDPASFSAAAQAVALDAARRVAVADVLAEQNRTFGGGRETEENIARLRDGAVAVVTGSPPIPGGGSGAPLPRPGAAPRGRSSPSPFP